MNLRLILAMGSMLVCAPALADQWRQVASTDEEIVLIDTRSVKADGDEVRVRLVRDFHDAQLTFVNGRVQTYQSQLTLYAVDCIAREVRYVEWGLYSAKRAQGSPVAHGKPRGAVYSRTLALPGEGSMLETVCERPWVTDGPALLLAQDENL
jgi:hypothetical protein